VRAGYQRSTAGACARTPIELFRAFVQAIELLA
jgi:hypothetical protein